MPSFLILTDVLAVVLFFRYLGLLLYPRRTRALPPGPRPLPLIGNLLDLPLVDPHKVYAEWRHEYGNFIYVDCFGIPLYTLNSLEDAVNVLEKLGAKASSRPHFTMSAELLGWGRMLVLQKYGDRLRESRRLLRQHIGAKGQLKEIMDKFHELEERKTRESLKRIMLDPENVQAHIRKTAASVILEMSYGYDVNEGRDSLVDELEEAMVSFNMSCVVGTFLVDFIPALKHIPSWMPGAGWKRNVKKWRAQVESITHRPYKMALDQMARLPDMESFVSEHYSKTANEFQDYTLKTTAASLYTGGADTSVSVIYSFVLAMTLYPEVQRRAQQEIDAVIGSDRLPALEDREQLPYLCALVSEVYRWMPVVPLTVRETTDDIHYKGYLIPKGSMVQANIWLFLHDPEVHQNPEEFRPERFIRTESHEPERDPRRTVFGFGRRICPGLNIAELSIFISCAMFLAVFDISKTVVDGLDVTPKADVVTGIITHPKPFPCSIRPRSTKAEALILAAGRA